jgi:hypothetical protein
MNTEPENNQEKIEEDQPVEKKDSILESIKFVVDMMNSGKANAKDVYPKGRYQGD